MLVTNRDKVPNAPDLDGLQTCGLRCRVVQRVARIPVDYPVATKADSLAVFQYTSGTTRELPEAVKHNHRTLVTLMVAALYGTGIRPGDRFICPSSPAWGHGLWHGTFAPLALGLTVGAYTGKFDPKRLLHALHDHRFTNMSAAATHYRMMRNSRARPRLPLLPQKALVHGRADRHRIGRLRARNFRSRSVQHVRHHRDRRGAGQLSRSKRFRRQARLTGQGDPGRAGPGAGRSRSTLRSRRHRTPDGVSP